MPPNSSPDETLLQMLADIKDEADAIRPHDPTRAAALDNAAFDLRAVIEEQYPCDADDEPAID